jgi:hypothetical protein
MKSLKLMFVVVLSSAWLSADASASQREDHTKQTVKACRAQHGRSGPASLDAQAVDGSHHLDARLHHRRRR